MQESGSDKPRYLVETFARHRLATSLLLLLLAAAGLRGIGPWPAPLNPDQVSHRASAEIRWPGTPGAAAREIRHDLFAGAGPWLSQCSCRRSRQRQSARCTVAAVQNNGSMPQLKSVCAVLQSSGWDNAIVTGETFSY